MSSYITIKAIGELLFPHAIIYLIWMSPYPASMIRETTLVLRVKQ